MFNKRELDILSEALEMYAIKYEALRTPEGKITIREEPEEAMMLFQKILEL